MTLGLTVVVGSQNTKYFRNIESLKQRMGHSSPSSGRLVMILGSMERYSEDLSNEPSRAMLVPLHQGKPAVISVVLYQRLIGSGREWHHWKAHEPTKDPSNQSNELSHI